MLFNTERPHQGINGATPAERYHASAKARPHPGPRPAPVSYKNKPVRPGGAVELGNKFRVNIGHQWTGATVTVVRDNLDVAILHDGKLIKRLVIDPDRRIQVSGLKLGRPPTRYSPKRPDTRVRHLPSHDRCYCAGGVRLSQVHLRNLHRGAGRRGGGRGGGLPG